MRNKFTGIGTKGYHPLRKIRHAWSGLRFALVSDFSVAYKLVLSAVILTSSFHFRQWVDFVVVLVVTGEVLMAEMFNTAIEALCDFVENRHDDRIGAIKDVAAAAAGVSILVWAAVLAYEYYGLYSRVVG